MFLGEHVSVILFEVYWSMYGLPGHYLIQSQHTIKDVNRNIDSGCFIPELIEDQVVVEFPHFKLVIQLKQ